MSARDGLNKCAPSVRAVFKDSNIMYLILSNIELDYALTMCRVCVDLFYSVRKQALAKMKSIEKAADFDFQEALEMASEMGYIQGVDFLLRRKSRFIKDLKKPVMIAAFREHFDLVDNFLEFIHQWLKKHRPYINLQRPYSSTGKADFASRWPRWDEEDDQDEILKHAICYGYHSKKLPSGEDGMFHSTPLKVVTTGTFRDIYSVFRISSFTIPSRRDGTEYEVDCKGVDWMAHSHLRQLRLRRNMFDSNEFNEEGLLDFSYQLPIDQDVYFDCQDKAILGLIMTRGNLERFKQLFQKKYIETRDTFFYGQGHILNAIFVYNRPECLEFVDAITNSDTDEQLYPESLERRFEYAIRTRHGYDLIDYYFDLLKKSESRFWKKEIVYGYLAIAYYWSSMETVEYIFSKFSQCYPQEFIFELGKEPMMDWELLTAAFRNMLAVDRNVSLCHEVEGIDLVSESKKKYKFLCARALRQYEKRRERDMTALPYESTLNTINPMAKSPDFGMIHAGGPKHYYEDFAVTGIRSIEWDLLREFRRKWIADNVAAAAAAKEPKQKKLKK